jgi:hypothetical protein
MLVDQQSDRGNLRVHGLALCRCRNWAENPTAAGSSQESAREAAAETLRLRNAAAILLATARAGAPAPGAPLAAFAAIRRLTSFRSQRCTRTGHCSCSRKSGRRDGDWWKLRHNTSTSLASLTSLTSPASREATRTRRSSLPPDACTDAHGTHARTHAQLAADCAVGQADSAALLLAVHDISKRKKSFPNAFCCDA